MLAYLTKRVYPKTVNMMTLEIPTGGYVYVQKGTYDQALTLQVKQNFDSLMNLLDCGDTNVEAIVYAFENIPEPLNMFAPFLGLVQEEIPLEIDKVLGALFVITTSISPYSFIKKPKEVRKTLEFSGSILKEFIEPWKAFQLQCVEEDMMVIGMPFPVHQGFFGETRTGRFSPSGRQGGGMMSSLENPDVDYHRDEDFNGDEVSTIDLGVDRGAEAGTEVEVTLEDLEADPNWENLGGGMWFNNVTGLAITMDDGTTEEDFEAEMARMMEEVRAEEEAAEAAPVKATTKPAASGNSKLEELKAKMLNKEK